MKAAGMTAVLFGFWLAITTSLAPFDLAIGLGLALVLAVWSQRFLWPQDAWSLTPRQALRFAAYIPQLIWSVIVAAVQVAEVVFDPRMPVRPVMIDHRTTFHRDISRVAYANSITLTPGTLTVDVIGDTFRIHCLSERFADEIMSGELERKIARVFEE